MSSGTFAAYYPFDTLDVIPKLAHSEKLAQFETRLKQAYANMGLAASTMAPNRPLPMGRASFQVLAGARYQSVGGGCSPDWDTDCAGTAVASRRASGTNRRIRRCSVTPLHMGRGIAGMARHSSRAITVSSRSRRDLVDSTTHVPRRTRTTV